MKKINSIGYAHKIIGLAVIFLIILPVSCYTLLYFTNIRIFAMVASVLLGIGLFISIAFMALLIIEFHQDKTINKKYAAIKKTKLVLGNGSYECQSCGNRQVKETSRECGVCGIRYYQEKD